MATMIFIAKFDASGTNLWSKQLGGNYTQPDYYEDAKGVYDPNCNCIYVAGTFYNTVSIGTSTFTSYLGQDIYLAKLYEIVGLEEGAGRTSNSQLLIYSNPNSGNCTVTIPDEFIVENHLTLQVIDQGGRLIRSLKIELSNEKVKLNLESLSKGTYIVTLSNGKKVYNGRMIVE